MRQLERPFAKKGLPNLLPAGNKKNRPETEEQLDKI
jgi:hypothetical protein